MPLLPILLLVLMVLPDLYIWLSFVRGAVAPVWSLLYWLPFVLTLLGVLAFMMGYANHFVLKCTLFLFLVFALPKILFAVFALGGKLLSLLHVRFMYIGIGAAVVVSFCAFIMSLYGFVWGWQRMEVRTVAVGLRNLPNAFEGYRIVQISDLHLGTFGNDTTLMHTMVEKVNSLHPDMVVFTGDLVNTSPTEAQPFLAVLSQLRACDGVYSILGNHDYSTYHPDKSASGRLQRLEQLVNLQQSMGWHLLRDAHAVVRRAGDSLVIAGVENVARPPFPSRGDLKKALKGVDSEACVVLLSHDPMHWRREVLADATNVGLTLSGHTHAMQFKVHKFSPAQWIYDEWGGHYVENERHLVVSTGAGSNIPFRFGAWPEVVEIVLHQK